jgi:hypothetical protein
MTIKLQLVGVEAEAYSPGLTREGTQGLLSWLQEADEEEARFVAEALASLGVEEVRAKLTGGRVEVTLNWPDVSHMGQGTSFKKALDEALDSFGHTVFFNSENTPFLSL